MNDSKRNGLVSGGSGYHPVDHHAVVTTAGNRGKPVRTGIDPMLASSTATTCTSLPHW